MADYSMSQANKNAVNKLKNQARQAQYHKQMGLPAYAENDIKALFE